MPNFCAASPEINTASWHGNRWWISKNRNCLVYILHYYIPSHCSLTAHTVEYIVCPLLLGCLCISTEHCEQKWALHCSHESDEGSPQLPHSSKPTFSLSRIAMRHTYLLLFSYSPPSTFSSSIISETLRSITLSSSAAGSISIVTATPNGLKEAEKEADSWWHHSHISNTIIWKHVANVLLMCEWCHKDLFMPLWIVAASFSLDWSRCIVTAPFPYLITH